MWQHVAAASWCPFDSSNGSKRVLTNAVGCHTFLLLLQLLLHPKIVALAAVLPLWNQQLARLLFVAGATTAAVVAPAAVAAGPNACCLGSSPHTMLLAALAIRGHRSAHSLATGPVMAEPVGAQPDKQQTIKGAAFISPLLPVLKCCCSSHCTCWSAAVTCRAPLDGCRAATTVPP